MMACYEHVADSDRSSRPASVIIFGVETRAGLRNVRQMVFETCGTIPRTSSRFIPPHSYTKLRRGLPSIKRQTMVPLWSSHKLLSWSFHKSQSTQIQTHHRLSIKSISQWHLPILISVIKTITITTIATIGRSTTTTFASTRLVVVVAGLWAGVKIPRWIKRRSAAWVYIHRSMCEQRNPLLSVTATPPRLETSPTDPRLDESGSRCKGG